MRGRTIVESKSEGDMQQQRFNYIVLYEFITLALSVEHVVDFQTSGIDDKKHVADLWAQLDGAADCERQRYTQDPL